MRMLDKHARALRARRARHAAPTRYERYYERSSARRTGWSSAPARPAAARPRRSTRRSPRSTATRSTSMTIEDPVEYVFPTINQIQINEQAGVTFADRAAVDPAPGPRRDPRRRDPRRRDRAHRGAGRAHRPLRASRRCTPPTRRRALHRFLDMGIEPFLIASSMLGVVGQRLVRRICPHVHERRTSRRPRSSRSTSAAAAPTRRRSCRGEGCKFCGEHRLLRPGRRLRGAAGHRRDEGAHRRTTRRTTDLRDARRSSRACGRSATRRSGWSTEDVTTIAEVLRTVYVL